MMSDAVAFLYLFDSRRTPDPESGRVIEFVYKGWRLFLTPSEHWYFVYQGVIFLLAWTVVILFGLLVPAMEKLLSRQGRIEA
jgi:hypothetical protein